jgi:tetratricopeptide (TPR) repeat protein
MVDTLPLQDNNSLIYLHQGIYYGLRGEMAATRSADGFLMMNDRTRTWYEKTAQVLERGSEIDLAANELSRAAELKRGNTNIPDVGSAEIYLYLGFAYKRLGMDEKALDAFRYMRHLDPEDPTSYFQIASAELALGRTEDATVSFIQCVILDPQRNTAWRSLIKIYSQTNREPIPAVEVTDGRARLREDNKLVRQHLLSAYRDFLKVARSSERPGMLREVRDAALNSYHFNPTLFDDALEGRVERPVPPSPVFHTYGKPLF